MKLLKIINPLLGLAFLGALVGIILYLFGPEPMLGSMTAYNIHQYGGTAFFILGLLHIILNRKWIKAAYFTRKKEKK